DDLDTIPIILPDTTDKNAFFVVEKMRKALNAVKVGNAQKPVAIAVGIAELAMQTQFDPLDIVTEVINRAELALESAQTEGPNSAKSLAPQMEPAAVA